MAKIKKRRKPKPEIPKRPGGRPRKYPVGTKPPPRPYKPGRKDYHKAGYAAKRQLDASQKHRDIASALDALPDTRNQERFERAKTDFGFFCQAYFGGAPKTIFNAPWSKDHLMVISDIDRVVLHGGRLAVAMPRGGGKSALAKAAMIWAILYGYRRYVCLIAATAEMAKDKLAEVRVMFNMQKIAEDWPRLGHIVNYVESAHQKASTMFYRGAKAAMLWGKSKLIFPPIPGEPWSETVITTTGLKGGGIHGQ